MLNIWKDFRGMNFAVEERNLYLVCDVCPGDGDNRYVYDFREQNSYRELPDVLEAAHMAARNHMHGY
jgi:hypothetical protein